MSANNSLPIINSATVMINSLAQQKMAAGVKVYNLSAGEPHLPPHKQVVAATLAVLEQGKIFYPPVAGLPELKQLAAQWMNDSYQCQYKTQNCLVVNGGKFGLYLLLQLLLQPQDEVIIAAPYWVSYPAITQIFAGNPVIVPTTPGNGWKLTLANIKKAYTDKTRILLLNSGTNPTGAVYSRRELAAILKFAAQHDLLVISDEVYSGLTYQDDLYVSCGSFPEYQDRVIVIQSCSKNFSMTGWRIGFVFAAENLISQLTSLVSQSTSGVAKVSQCAAIAVLAKAKQVNTWVRRAMHKRRDVLLSALNTYFKISVDPPIAGLYVFISLKELGIKKMGSPEFCRLALEQANVALVPGEAFGKEGFVRFSFGVQERDLKEGVKALAQFCTKLSVG
ncbi:MAG TPA: aminotransferase class I/II-fold pyridoxal phosphate-dependent enzyme [Gammaproteobacteria bacterium]|nr:aminotransferase class I/II-fold pyridoxal phosphate-dependent enzyme [Gammaproteobacteria bacterium]